MSRRPSGTWSRRDFLKGLTFGGAAAGLEGRSILGPRPFAEPGPSDVFSVTGIPRDAFAGTAGPNRHAGFDTLLHLMALRGLPFYRSSGAAPFSGPEGLIAADDVVLVKVNAQWKYRGCTSSDLVRGIVQAILDHPDGFRGEAVIVENGQGRGSLACDTSSSYSGDHGVHANAEDERHSFLWLAESLFRDPRVSARLLDPVRDVFIGAGDHATEGFRTFETVSYPCFTTAGGRRVEAREGIWTGSGHAPRLKVLNVPVLKHHDEGGSEITGALKHMYGLVSMKDGRKDFRHYEGLGVTAAAMMASVVRPALTVLDATWVSHASLRGYPASTTFRADRIAASQDPVALDAWAAAHVLYPIDRNPRHHPSFARVERWLAEAEAEINRRGGMRDLEGRVRVARVTRRESGMRVSEAAAGEERAARFAVSPQSLAFEGGGGDGLPGPQALTLWGPPEFRWTAEPGAPWLRAEPSSGAGPATIAVRARPDGADRGAWRSVLRLASPDVAGSPLEVPVTLRLRGERGGIRR